MSVDGATLPLLDPPAGEWWDVDAEVRSIASETFLVLPYHAPVGASRGRKFRIALDGGRPRRVVVFSVRGRAAVRAPQGHGLKQGEHVRLRVGGTERSRRNDLPPDLAAAMEEAGASATGFPANELTQLLLMINESSAPEVRSARVAAAVSAIVTWSRRSGR